MLHPHLLARRPAGLLWCALICLLLLPLLPPRSAALAYTGVFGWSAVAPSPIARTEAQGAAVGGKIYVLGGFYNSSYQATTRSDAYDPATNSWSRLADMPVALTHSAHAVAGELIYLVGGYVGDNPGPSTSRVLAYNTRTDTWAELPPLPAPRGAGVAAVVGRRLHYFGGALRVGRTTDATDTTDHWVLDLDDGAGWASASPLPAGRNHLGGVALGGKIYIIGGQLGKAEGTTSQARVDVYDPAGDSWSRAADLPVGRSHIEGSVLAVDGQIVVIGGSTDDGASGKASSAVYLYDPATNIWMQLVGLPGGRKSPVAAAIGAQLFSLTGGTGSPSSGGWRATLPDRWESQASAPIALGEVAAGIIGDKLYLVGEGSGATLRYSLGTNSWSSAAAARPFPGHHHAAEVIGGKLYLFGGLGSGAGKVQIYDPAANTWSLGADMPFAAGSSSSALIGGKVYVAGGIVGSSTTSRAAVYDPAANSWADLAPMPQGRNHAASGTDGERMYVFGGRGAGSGDNNTVANGFDTVQIYTPATDSWRSSLDPGSTLAPLPVGRGGMGKAVYAGGRFYVLGGETSSGPGATADGVYNRVDVYTPASNSWGELATMPTARHGMFPLLIGGRIYVAGGGTRAGYSQSTTLEVLNLPPTSDAPALTPTPANTETPTPTDTATPTSTATSSPTSTAEPTGTATDTPSATAEPTGTATSSPTGTAEPTGTATGSPTGTAEPTGTATSSPTSTAEPTGTATGTIEPTDVPTSTVEPTGTATDTPSATAAPSSTATHTPTRTATGSPTNTAEPTSTATGTPSATPAPLVVARINAGGPALSTGGQSWGADQYASGGSASTSNRSTAIAGTSDDALYLSRRLASSSLGSFSYAIPVPAPGSYRVRLHFAENYWGVSGGGAGGTGRRVFSVNLEGGPVELANLDLNAEATPLTAIVKELTVPVSDGALTIFFSASVDRPLVNAIEVIAAAQPSPTPALTATPTRTATASTPPTSTVTRTPTRTATGTPSATPVPLVVARINAGGPALNTGGQSWGADQYASGGSASTSNRSTAIAGTSDDALYLSRRLASSSLGSFSYAIPVPASGSYRVRLHFAENYWGVSGGGAGGTGRRVFSVNMEGGPVEIANLDLNAEAAPLTAIVKELTVPVSDGALTIFFSASVDRPLVNAIEVIAIE